MVRMKFSRRAAIAALLVGFGALAGTCLPALKRPAPNDDPNPTTTATLKQLVSGLLKGEYEPASFTPSHGDLPEHSNRQSIYGNGSPITARWATWFSLTASKEEMARCCDTR